MIITETGILVSTDPNMKEPAPLNFKIEGGQVGDNTVRATGLTGNTTYYAQSYFVKDGIYIRQKGSTEFKTAAQEEVLKIKNAYAGSNTIGITKNGSPDAITLDYSTDSGETWNTWNSANSNFSVNLAQGGEVWLKGNNNRLGFSTSAYFRFVSTRIFDCEGNLSALLRKDITVLPDYCFYGLFYSSKIRVAPVLPNSVELSPNCYSSMFEGSTSLTQAPVLPATGLASSCYSNMFYGCTSLTTAPALPATTLAQNCYEQMFSGCTSLTQAPVLPATGLASSCYSSMFHRCSALVQAPALPATTLAQNCYSYMFSGCTSITQAPELPATTLASFCYYGMFQGCTSLTQAPVLPATGLAQYCYEQMFYGCTLLNRIVCYATRWNTSYARDWVNSVAPTGDFYNLGGATIPIDSVNGVPIGWTLHTSLNDPLGMTNIESGQNTITLTKHGSPQDITLEYSTDDGSTWTSWSSANGNLSVTLEENETILFRGDNRTFSYDTSNYYQFGSTGKFSLSGDIMSLLSDDIISVPGYCFHAAFAGSNVTSVSSGLLPATTLANSCYLNMFKDCTSLTQAPDLPATTLASSCYWSMFQGCTSLTQAPALPATTLALSCYLNMFKDCTSLTQAPALPATTLASFCYEGMFYNCTALTQAPALPATALAEGCYQSMFYNCTALTQAPALPATTLTQNCYYSMFQGCTSLTQAPELPATTLAIQCYDQMFFGCTALAQAPTLPATTLTTSCYQGMFGSCTSLNRIVTYASDISATGCLSGWTYNVSSSGSFYNLGGATYPRGTSGIPNGWTEYTSL